MIRYFCHHCGCRLKADPSLAGRRSYCPMCQTTGIVPQDQSDGLILESRPAKVEPALSAQPPAPDQRGRLPQTMQRLINMISDQPEQVDRASLASTPFPPPPAIDPNESDPTRQILNDIAAAGGINAMTPADRRRYMATLKKIWHTDDSNS